MGNGKGKTGVLLASMIGLLAVAVLGAWLLTQNNDKQRVAKPVKPTVEVTR